MRREVGERVTLMVVSSNGSEAECEATESTEETIFSAEEKTTQTNREMQKLLIGFCSNDLG